MKNYNKTKRDAGKRTVNQPSPINDLLILDEVAEEKRLKRKKRGLRDTLEFIKAV